MFYAYVEWKTGEKEAYEYMPKAVAWAKYLEWWKTGKYAHVKFGEHG